MLSPLLEQLTKDDFHISIGFIHAPASVRRALLRSNDVRWVAMALRYGLITEEMIREFTSRVMGEFAKGQRLPNDLALAALAVVLERRPTSFAEEYLLDLARLNLAEMVVSIAIARECLSNRAL
jgi:hypothetical protein